MALIKCPECGREVSSTARACPNCGAPISELSKVKVHFFRKRVFGEVNTGTIFVDGNLIGMASNGCSYEVMLSPGSHSISIESKKAQRSSSETFNVPENAKGVEVEMAEKTSWGAALAGGRDIVVKNISVQR